MSRRGPSACQLRALLVLGPLALLLLGCERNDAAPTITGEPRSSTSAALPVAPDGVAAAVQPSVSRPSHPFQYDSLLEIQGSKLRSELGGRLVMSDDFKQGDGSWRCQRVLDARVLLTSGAKVQTDAPGIGEAFAVGTSADGSGLQVAFPRGVSQAARQLLVGLAGALQFHRPSGKPNTWISRETDASGPYESRYTSDPSTREFTKEKVAYLGDAHGLKVVESTSRYSFDEAGALREIGFHEAISEKTLSLAYLSNLRLQLTNGQGPLPTACVGQLPAEWETSPIEQASALDPLEAAKQLPQKTLTEALVELRAGPGAAFEPPTFLEVQAGLRAHPERLAELVEKVDTEIEYRATLAALLASVGTAESRGAIGAFVADPKRPIDARIGLMQALNFQGSVDEPMVALVGRLMHDSSERRVAMAATQLYPGLLTRLREGGASHPEFERAYVDVARACRGEDCQVFVRGLGALKSPAAIEALIAMSSNGDEDVRMATAVAFEMIDEASVDVALARLVNQEKSARVTRRAVRACGFRGSRTCLRALQGALRRTEGAVNLAAMDALGHGRFPDGAGRKALEAESARVGGAESREHLEGVLQSMDERAKVAQATTRGNGKAL